MTDAWAYFAGEARARSQAWGDTVRVVAEMQIGGSLDQLNPRSQ